VSSSLTADHFYFSTFIAAQAGGQRLIFLSRAASRLSLSMDEIARMILRIKRSMVSLLLIHIIVEIRKLA